MRRFWESHVALSLIGLIGLIGTLAACAEDNGGGRSYPAQVPTDHNGSKAQDTDALTVKLENAFATSSAGTVEWRLRDPGNGGGVSAMTVGPFVIDRAGGLAKATSNSSSGVYLGSDCGGIRASDQSDELSFKNRNFGLIYNQANTSATSDPTRLVLRGNAKNIADIVVEPIETGGSVESAPVWATATGGVIYKSVNRGKSWQPVFDVRNPDDKMISGTASAPIGAIAVSQNSGAKVVVAGFGNINQLVENHEVLAPLNDGISLKVLISEDSGATWSKVDLCPVKCAVDPAGHSVSDISGTVDANIFWVATTSGLFQLVRTDGKWVASDRTGGLPREIQSVQASLANPNDVVVLVSSNNTNGSIYWKDFGGSEPTTWKNLTGNLPKPTGGAASTYGRMLRSKSRPSELVVMGTKTGGTGVYFTSNMMQEPSARWIGVVLEGDVKAALAGSWKRRPDSQSHLWGGQVEIAIAEDRAGISSIFVNGWSGVMLRADRGSNNQFVVSNIGSTSSVTGLVSGQGQAPLQMSRGIVVDQVNPDRAIFLYFDNGFFVTKNGGASFAHPREVWSVGTGADFKGKDSVVSYIVGTNFDKQHRSGGLVRSSDDLSYEDIAMDGWPIEPSGLLRAPHSPLISSSDDSIYAVAHGKGVYRFVPDRSMWFSISGAISDTSEVIRLRKGSMELDEVRRPFVSIATKNGNIFLRFTHNESSTNLWHKLPLMARSGATSAPFAEAIDDFWIFGRRLFLRTEGGDLHTGAIPQAATSGEELSAVELWRVPAIRKYVAVPDRNRTAKTLNLALSPTDVAQCGGKVFATTVDGLWVKDTLSSEWAEIKTFGFRSLSYVTAVPKANGKCVVYIGTESAGGVYSAEI